MHFTKGASLLPGYWKVRSGHFLKEREEEEKVPRRSQKVRGEVCRGAREGSAWLTYAKRVGQGSKMSE